VTRTCWSSGRSGYGRRLDHKSRMRREPPVRIREGLGVKFPRATRLVIGTTREADARRIMEVLPKRMSKSGLTVHPEKTRLIRFHPVAAPDPETEERDPPAPRTFDFLGFTPYWGRSLRGGWVIKRKTAKGRLRRALQALSSWCRANLHEPVAFQHQKLSEKLRGHYAYYGIIGNFASLRSFLHGARRTWRRWLCRRGQAGPVTWEEFARLEPRYRLPAARVVPSLARRAASS
jgi:RNA-directed DNA polymerase